MSVNRGIYRYKEISLVTGLSIMLVKQYIKLLRESKKDKLRKENLGMLITRSSYREDVKKRVAEASSPVGAMTGGLL